jgi:hypothetical protein
VHQKIRPDQEGPWSRLLPGHTMGPILNSKHLFTSFFMPTGPFWTKTICIYRNEILFHEGRRWREENHNISLSTVHYWRKIGGWTIAKVAFGHLSCFTNSST